MNTIYGSVVSPFVRKVLTVLHIKKIDYEACELIPFISTHKQQLLKINPLGKVPIYKEGDFTLIDSSVICAYLEKKYSENSIYPTDAENYAKCLWYEEYADTQLIPSILTIFFNTLLADKFNLQPDQLGVQIALEEKLPAVFDYLDSELGNRQYLAGNQFSLADIAMTAPFINLELAGHSIDAKRWQNLSRYVKFICQEQIISALMLEVRKRLTSNTA